MKKALIVTYCMPKSYSKWIFSKDPIPGVQSNTFAHSLVRVFEHTNMEITVLSSPPVQDYPICPIPNIPETTLAFRKAKGIVFSTSNKPIRKRLQRLQYIIRETIRQKPDYLIIHGLHLPYIVAGAMLSLMGYQTVLVLTDPSGVVLPGDGTLRRVLKSIDKRLTRIFTRQFRYGIGLSPKLLNHYMPRRNHLVFPGIFPEQKSTEASKSADRQPTCRNTTLDIGYFGGVFPGYGVLEIAEIISQCDLPVTLNVFGVGSELTKIKDISARDERIQVRGIVERDQALAYMRSFDVLINPRTPATEMEENSFPSKIFDYALSERAILTTPLKSLPSKIRDNLFEYKSNDREDVLVSLSALVHLPRESLTETGRQFSQSLRAEYNVTSLGINVSNFLSDRAA